MNSGYIPFQKNLFEPMLLFFISFSDITFRLFAGSESSPFPLMILLMIYLLRGKIDKVTVGVIFLLLMLAVFSVLSDVKTNTVLISLATYIQLCLVFIYYKKFGYNLSYSLCRIFVLIHLAVGFFQYFGIFGFLLEKPLSLLLERSNATALLDIGRGVAFITTEPSHSLQSIILPIFLLSLSKSQGDKFLSLLSIVATLFLSSAGVTAIYVIVIISAVMIYKPKFILPLFLVMVVSFEFLGGRALDTFQTIYNFIYYGNIDSIYVVLEFSGFRFPSVVAPLLSLDSLPRAFGIGAWELNILESLYRAGFNVENLGHWKFTKELHPIKPYSILGNLVSDFWWLGFIFFAFIWVGLLNSVVRCKYIKNGGALPFGICFLALFAISFLVTAGKPAFVAIMGIVAYHYDMERRGNVAANIKNIR